MRWCWSAAAPSSPCGARPRSRRSCPRTSALGVPLEGQHVRADAIEEPEVVGDDHRAPGKGLQPVLERSEGFDVEVVDGLVQEEGVPARRSTLARSTRLRSPSVTGKVGRTKSSTCCQTTETLSSKSVYRRRRDFLVGILLIAHGLTERLDERSPPVSLDSLPGTAAPDPCRDARRFKHEPSPSSFAATTMPGEKRSHLVRTTVFGTVRRPRARQCPRTGGRGRSEERISNLSSLLHGSRPAVQMPAVVTSGGWSPERVPKRRCP
jgi:hypothetical protein